MESEKSQYSPDRSIILTGFMGAGKTSVGRILADKFGLPFYDTDDMLVNEEKMSINEIFAREGEEYFRDLETELLYKIKEFKKCVLAVGGGTVLRSENRLLLRKFGWIVYLKTEADVILKRISMDNRRPLLKTANPLLRIRELIENRTQAYLDCDLVMENTHLGPETVALELIESLGEKWKKSE